MEKLPTSDTVAALRIIWERDYGSHWAPIEANLFGLLRVVDLEGWEIGAAFAHACLAGDLRDAALFAEKYGITGPDVGELDLSPILGEEALLLDELANAKQTRVLRWLVDFFQPKSVAELGRMGVLRPACRYGLFGLVKSLVGQFDATSELAEATKPFLAAAEGGDVQLLKWLAGRGLDYGQSWGEACGIAVGARKTAAARYLCGSEKVGPQQNRMELLDAAVRSGSPRLLNMVLTNFAVSFENALDYWLGEKTSSRIARRLETMNKPGYVENPRAVTCFLNKILQQRIAAPSPEAPC
jgi:hypothetical protein